VSNDNVVKQAFDDQLTRMLRHRARLVGSSPRGRAADFLAKMLISGPRLVADASAILRSVKL
jgi:hypothetical protein